MFAIKRNQVVVTALAVMIAVAGYLNFTESKTSGEISTVDLNDPTSYEALLNDDGSIATLADDEDYDGLEFALGENIEELEPVYDDTGAAIYVSTTADTYFVQAKLEREQARASQKDMLTEMINNTNIDEAKKQECADSLLEIQQRIEKETAAEAMIESKGFSEVYVRIDDDTVDVVVNKSELTDAELAQIMDIVTRKTGMKESQVRISPLKSSTSGN
ncbi:MAG: SpoIIIAH-like family protein [Clostridiales bacterium]|nr:SpoIIIAH-like family protein [Clostridiales bacterium]